MGRGTEGMKEGKVERSEEEVVVGKVIGGDTGVTVIVGGGVLTKFGGAAG